MLKAGHVSASLARAVNEIQAFSKESDSKEIRITASLTSSDGSLVASSSTRDSALFEVCQRVSAVAASIALEYRALENIMTHGFRSVFISTDKRLIFCDHFAELKEAGSILLVLTVDTDSSSDKMVDIGLLRSLSSRIKEDFLPSISPVLETLILFPPTE